MKENQPLLSNEFSYFLGTLHSQIYGNTCTTDIKLQQVELLSDIANSSLSI